MTNLTTLLILILGSSALIVCSPRLTKSGGHVGNGTTTTSDWLEPFALDGELANGTDDHHVVDKHVQVHVVSWNFNYVSDALVLGLFVIVICVLKLIFHYADCLSSIVPESCLLILIGVAMGAILHAAMGELASQIELHPRLFMLFLLPPIVLDSAYSLNDRVVFNNLGRILTYAVIGTVLNCFIIGPALYFLAKAGAMGDIRISLVQCLLFSSFIIAVDPVAVLAIFTEIGVNNVLYFLVFGESLLNDAVTIVIYNSMKTFNDMDTIPVDQIFVGIASFFTVSLGGLAIGIALGTLTALLTRTTSHVKVVEPLLILTMAYVSFLCGELVHWSGIISMIGCGLMQAQYAFHNVSQKSLTTVTYFTKMMSSLTDAIIFLFLGLEVIRFDFKQWHIGFVMWSLILCLVVRLITVFGLTKIINTLDKLNPIAVKEQFIMWYGGLRGAVCFALCETINDSFEHKNMFMSTTLVIIFFTVFVQGITIKPIVGLCHIERKSGKQEDSVTLEFNKHVMDHMMAGIETIIGHMGNNYLREQLQRLNDHHLRRFLQNNPMTQDERIIEFYQKVAIRDHVNHIFQATATDSELQDEYEKEDDEHAAEEEVITNVPQKPVEAALPRRSSSKTLLSLRRRRYSAFNKPCGDADVDGLRAALSRTAMSAFHETYDRNLTRESETDLLGALQQKHRRITENARIRSAHSAGASPGVSPYFPRPLRPRAYTDISDISDDVIFKYSNLLEDAMLQDGSLHSSSKSLTKKDDQDSRRSLKVVSGEQVTAMMYPEDELTTPRASTAKGSSSKISKGQGSPYSAGKGSSRSIGKSSPRGSAQGSPASRKTAAMLEADVPDRAARRTPLTSLEESHQSHPKDDGEVEKVGPVTRKSSPHSRLEVSAPGSKMRDSGQSSSLASIKEVVSTEGESGDQHEGDEDHDNTASPSELDLDNDSQVVGDSPSQDIEHTQQTDTHNFEGDDTESSVKSVKQEPLDSLKSEVQDATETSAVGMDDTPEVIIEMSSAESDSDQEPPPRHNLDIPDFNQERRGSADHRSIL